MKSELMIKTTSWQLYLNLLSFGV